MSELILLTGATGFVGRQVLNELLERDIHVRCVVRGENQLPASKLMESLVTTRDLFQEEESWWAKALQGIATIIHVAWFAEPGKYLDSPKNIDCLIGTLRLAQAAVRAGVRRFVGIGTCAEYIFSNSDLSTETPLEPLSPYAGAKAAAFLSLSRWLQNEGMEFAWCRLFNLYGEGEDARRLVSYIHNQLRENKPANLTCGTQIRDFMDVREAGKQIARIALGDYIGPANICSGMPVSVRQIAEKIADQYGRRDLLQFGVRPDNLLDPPRVVGVPSFLE
jgi:nucleoside-diphosphate-sugar epimerase